MPLNKKTVIIFVCLLLIHCFAFGEIKNVNSKLYCMSQEIKADAGEDVTICKGETTSLTASGGTSYSWSNQETSFNINVSPSITTTYYVTAYNGASNAEDMVVVYVNNVTANAGDDKTINKGTSTLLIASGGGTYIWSDGQENMTIPVSPSEKTTYTVTVNKWGCTASDDVIITLAKPDTMIITVNADKDTICKGDSVILTISGADSYIWETGEITSSIKVSPSKKTTYKVTGSKNGLTASETIIINVLNNPTPNINGYQIICIGDSTMLNVSDFPNIKWSTGETSKSIYINPTQNTTYSVTTTDKNGCIGTDNIEISAINTLSLFLSNDVTISVGDTTTLFASGGFNYSWDNGSTDSNINVSPTANTEYHVTAKVQSCTAEGSVTVKVIPPNKNINAGPDVEICRGDNSYLKANKAEQYSWSTGETQQTINVLPTITTSYSLTGTINGATSVDTVIVTVNDIPNIIITNVNHFGDTVCLGTVVTLKASGGLTYSWNTKKENESITAKLTKTTTFIVDGSNSKCIGSTEKTITVINLDAGEEQTTCNGGTVTLSASGWNKYKWDTGDTTTTINVEPTTTTKYNVYAEHNGCTTVDSVIVKIIASPIADAGYDLTICKGTNAYLYGYGGLTYSWNTGSISKNLVVSPTENTTYTLTVYDKYSGCSNVDTAIINIISVNADAGSDKTIKNGEITSIKASGGGIYSWDIGSVKDIESVSPTTSTIYKLTVVKNGCTSTDNVAIYVINNHTEAFFDQTICNGDTIFINALGATSYSWSNGDTASSIKVSPTITTKYYVIGTNTGVTSIDSVTVTVNPKPDVKIIAGENPICTGKGTTLTVTGALNYKWDVGDINNSINIEPKTNTIYSVTGTNNYGCSTKANINVNVGKIPIADAGEDQTICNGYKVLLKASGGNEYLWNNGANTDTTTICPIKETTYTITVGINGCLATDDIVIFLNPSPISNFIKDQTICQGTNTYIKTKNPNNYFYTWVDGNTIDSILVNPTETSSYILTVSLDNCTNIDTVTINVAYIPIADAGTNKFICDYNPSNHINLYAVKDSIIVSYLWSTGNTEDSISVKPSKTTTYTLTVNSLYCSNTDEIVVFIEETPNISLGNDTNICFGSSINIKNITENENYIWNNGSTEKQIQVSPTTKTTYSLTITNNYCSNSDEIVINVHNKIIINAIIKNVLCYEGQNGKIEIIAKGGTEPYSYLWNNNQTKSYLENISAGEYNIIVKDSNNCIDSSKIHIDHPNSPISIKITITNATCLNDYEGTIKTNINGGTPPYSLKWSNGQTTNSITSLMAGIYTITVTDSLGCNSISSVTINKSSVLNASFAVPSDIRAVSCNGANDGSAKVTATGGSGVYTYSWSNGQTTDSAIGLEAGIYSVTVNDSLGCDTIISVMINEPNILVASFAVPSDIRAVSCHGGNNGSAKITVAGGSGVYTYLWSNDQTTNSATGLIAGFYTVTVMDSLGCDTILSLSINEPPILRASIISADIRAVSCYGNNDGSAKVTVTGGSGVYTYLWSNGHTSDSVTTLIAGFYTVTVKDSLGCDTILSVTINEPTILGASIIPSDIQAVSCKGGNDGSVKVKATGGSGVYKYLWSNGQKNDRATTLIAGTYTVTVKDSLGCDTILSVTINEPDILSASILNKNVIHIKCAGELTGSAKVTAVKGGSGAYSYLWDDALSQTSYRAVGLKAGIYTVTISDSLGCDTILSVTINEPTKMTIITSNSKTVCLNESVEISVNVKGGILPYSYTWSNTSSLENKQTVNPINEFNSYIATATDSNGCVIVSDTIFINQYPQMTSLIYTDGQNPKCYYDTSNIYIQVSGGGGGPYTFIWDDGYTLQSNARQIYIEKDKTFYVTIKDYCVNDIYDSIQIEVLSKPFIEIIPTLSKDCVPMAVSFGVSEDMSVFIKLDSIEWYFGDSTSGIGNNIIHEYNESGFFDVSIKTKGTDGCYYKYAFNNYVEVYPNPEADFTYFPEDVTTSNPEVKFTDISIGTTYCYWTFGDTLLGKHNYSIMQNPKHNYDKKGEYIVNLFITNEYGCYDSVSKIIKVKETYMFYAPNTITADGDGLNDYFYPIIFGLDENYFEMRIYSRFGEEIYCTNDIHKPWDGKVRSSRELVQIGVYVWLIITQDIEGKKHHHMGNVTVIR
ncbi:MAG: hypothetical protein A2X02_01545 [Bacteroidetes bacterium GWF2_29_10]|nr:MAG: hypothetical protein A2X02_01545 [Bacteroidetes bacterium GWF2_29_10]